MACKNCKSNKLVKVFKLGKQTISSVFNSTKKFNQKKYSLDLYSCQSCKLVQFKNLAPLNEMYGETYGYRTSLSKLMVRHIKEKYSKILKYISLSVKDYILDIGSNDGTFLNIFAKNNFQNLIGIDPSSEKFKQYYHKKISVFSDFFPSTDLNKFIKNKIDAKVKFKLISSFAMFYDIEKPDIFCKEIYNLLDKEGIWISEFSYFPLLLKNLTYDQICHEHVTYYSLSTFKSVVEKQKFKIIDISFNQINGGSIEVICAKQNSKIKSNSKKINSILKEEYEKINTDSFENLQTRVDNTKNVLNFVLSNIKSSDIIGYGASTKGNIVLNQCGLTSKNISFICDENPYKYGRYTPGSNIKIISKKEMRKIRPKYLLVLIWSFRKEVILQELDYLKKGGKMIFHLPSLHIIDKDNYKNFLNKDFKEFAFDY